MATTIKTGSTNTSQGSVWSSCTSYSGTTGASCRLLGDDGFHILVGGLSFGVTNNLLTLFRLGSKTTDADGKVQWGYEWRRETATAVNDHIQDPQATTLYDAHTGYALITGGHQGYAGVSNKTHLFRYLLNTDTWDLTSSGNMTAARGQHRCTALNTFDVLATGGFSVWPISLKTCERWDPTTGVWAACASMNDARSDHAQIRLLDGRVLVMGGRTTFGFGDSQNRCEIYDPTANTWTLTGEMTYRRYGATAILLPSGNVLVIGGSGRKASRPGANAALATAELWDPSTGTWTHAGKMKTARSYPTAMYLASSGRVMVVGGLSTETEIWTEATSRWSIGLAALSIVRSTAVTVACEEDEVLVSAGGVNAAGVSLEVCHILTPASDAVGDGDVNGQRTVIATPTPTTFTYQTTRNSIGSFSGAASATPVAAPEGSAVGPYALDPPTALALTSVGASVAAALTAGRSHPTLTLVTSMADPTPALAFPDEEGWLAFRIGRTGQVGPIRYHGRLSGTQLRLDASYVFGSEVQIGDDVVLLEGAGAVTAGVASGAAHATASTSGRVAAESLAVRVVAGGMRIVHEILYPGDRGLGNEGEPTIGAPELAGVVDVFAGDDVDDEVAAARTEVV